VRGTVYATAGQIGGNTIDATSIHSGTTGYGTGAGFYLGSNGTFSLSNKLTWDGSTLSINGGGTFTGNVSGGQFTTGAYTGYAWPAVNNYGSYLGPSGLLLGNANNNKYFKVTYDGNVYAPGFSIVNGAAVLTGSININNKSIIDSDGNASFTGVVLSRNMVVASGNIYIGPITNGGGEFSSQPFYIDTGIPISSWTGGINPYVAHAGTSGTWYSYDNNYTNDYWGVTCEILPWTRWSGTATIHLAVTVHIRNMYTLNAKILWKVYYVT